MYVCMYVCRLGQSVCLMTFVSEVKAKELMITIFAHRRYTHIEPKGIISDIDGVLDGGTAPTTSTCTC